MRLYCLSVLHITLCVSTSCPSLAPHCSLLSGNQYFVFSVCESVSVSLYTAVCITLKNSTYKWYHTVFVKYISLGLIFSRSIYIAADGRISFFFMAGWYSFCVCVYTTSACPLIFFGGCLHILDVLSSAVTNTGAHLSFQINVLIFL